MPEISRSRLPTHQNYIKLSHPQQLPIKGNNHHNIDVYIPIKLFIRAIREQYRRSVHCRNGKQLETGIYGILLVYY